MKKKNIIIISIVSVVVIASVIGAILLFPKSNKNEEQDDNKIVYKSEVIITLEDSLPSINDYIEKGSIDNEELIYKNEDDEIVTLEDKKIGIYYVYIDDEKISTLKIIDDKKPELFLQEVTIKEEDKYDIKDFVKECSDNSGEECILSYKEKEMANIAKEGTYDITIIAKDSSENETEESTKLIIEKKAVNKSKPVTNKPTVTETPKKEVSNEDVTYKYGTKIIKYTYSNGTSNNEYDYTTFNGTTNDMKPEASSLVSSNNGIYQEVVNITNGYRTEKNVSGLTLDNNLSLAATIRAIEIAYADKFSHTRPNGTQCFTVLTELGVDAYIALGENIAYATYNLSPSQVCEMWKNSPGHYANMVEESFTKIGIGKYTLGGKTYFVQMFGA